MDAWTIIKWAVGIFVLGYGFFLAVDAAYKKREETGDAIAAANLKKRFSKNK